MSGVQFTDVPDRYDVVIQLSDGSTRYGFLLADSIESNLPFRTHKAVYTYSPTFLERQNVSDQYGDNFQDFFLTGAQDDFSLGEGQKYFKVNDASRSRRYWNGNRVDPFTYPGNVTLTQTLTSTNINVGGPNISALIPAPLDYNTVYGWATADTTYLYKVGLDGTTTSTAHSGTYAGNVCVAVDNSNVFVSGRGGSSNIRKYATNTTWSTFSATTYITQMAFLNNILYGYKYDTDALISFDSSGTATTQFTWKNADGTAVANNSGATCVGMIAYGGVLFILRQGSLGLELWKYDGSGVLMQGRFPPEFQAAGAQMAVSEGIVFISSVIQVSTGVYKPTIYYYVSGTIGKLWEAKSTTVTALGGGVTSYRDGVAFGDASSNEVLRYDLSTGGVNAICDTALFAVLRISSGVNAELAMVPIASSTVGKVYGYSSSYNSTGYIQTSLYTFDNTLTKIFRGIKVDADLPSNTSVDIKYQLDSVTGAYTTLQTGATSGTEYLLPNNTTGQGLSVQVTLNSSSGVNTPTVKRVYVRAAPTLQQFRKRQFIFDLSGGYRSTKGKVARVCRDGTPYPYDGFTASSYLVSIATQTQPVTIQDRFGQYTAMPDLQPSTPDGYDGFAIYELHPGVYIARINFREV